MAKKTNLKKKLSNFKLTCHVKEGNFLANITHIFHFFFPILIIKYKLKNLANLISKLSKMKKRKKYDELKTKIKY